VGIRVPVLPLAFVLVRRALHPVWVPHAIPARATRRAPPVYAFFTPRAISLHHLCGAIRITKSGRMPWQRPCPATTGEPDPACRRPLNV